MNHVRQLTKPVLTPAIALSIIAAGAKLAHSQDAGPEIRIGGYVKVDFIQDFDPIGNSFQFKTDAIPVDGTATADQGGQTTIHARETRLTLTLLDKTSKHALKAYVEGDFYGDGSTFRFRHAYGEFGEFLGGQTWTTFMDFSSRPRSLDYEGPDSEIFVRQAMIRWTRSVSARWKLAVAVEQPGGQFAIPAGLTGTARSNVPDVPAALRYEGKRGHAQLAGIVRQIRFDGESGSPDVTAIGVGANLSFRMNTRSKDALMGEIAFGNGIGRYVESLNGQGADAVFADSDELAALGVLAAVVGYQHGWSDQLLTSAAFSMALLESDDHLAGSAVEQTMDARANLIWSPHTKVDAGGEVLFGRRVNQDEASGQAWRLQFSLIYKLG